MSDLTKLPNIGKTVAQQLEEIGIHTAQELADLGSRDAWLRIRQMTLLPATTAFVRWKALSAAYAGTIYRRT